MNSSRKMENARSWKAARYAATLILASIVFAVVTLSLLWASTTQSGPQQAAAQKTSQEAVVAPNENLVVEGIPPIPVSLAERADRYTNFRTAIFASWHPARREMLIATRFADTFQIHEVKAPGAARTQLTFYRDDVRSAQYPPTGNGDFFIFSKDIGGGEFYQVYRYDTANGDVTLLTDGKSRNTDEKWSNSGKLIVYGSTRRTGNDVDLWLCDPANPSDAKTNRMLAQLSGGGGEPLD